MNNSNIRSTLFLWELGSQLFTTRGGIPFLNFVHLSCLVCVCAWVDGFSRCSIVILYLKCAYIQQINIYIQYAISIFNNIQHTHISYIYTYLYSKVYMKTFMLHLAHHELQCFSYHRCTILVHQQHVVGPCWTKIVPFIAKQIFMSKKDIGHMRL